jgi:hypothetical protein
MYASGYGCADKLCQQTQELPWAPKPQLDRQIPNDSMQSHQKYEFNTLDRYSLLYEVMGRNSTAREQTSWSGLSQQCFTSPFDDLNAERFTPASFHDQKTHFTGFCGHCPSIGRTPALLPESDNDVSETEFIYGDSPSSFYDSASVDDDDPPTTFLSSLLRDTMPLGQVHYDLERMDDRVLSHAALEASAQTDPLLASGPASGAANSTSHEVPSIHDRDVAKGPETQDNEANASSSRSSSPARAARHGKQRTRSRGKQFVEGSENSKIMFSSFKIRKQPQPNQRQAPSPTLMNLEGLRRISYYESVLEFDSGSSV